MGRTKKEHRKPRTIIKKPKPSEWVTRADWGAKEALSKAPLQLPVYNVMIKYYTDTPPCVSKAECTQSMRQLQDKYMDAGIPDIPYNFVIGGDDRIYEGRGWFLRSYKVQDDMPQWEAVSLDIAYIGQRRPGKDMTLACSQILETGVLKKCIVTNFSFEILTGVELPPPGSPIDFPHIM